LYFSTHHQSQLLANIPHLKSDIPSDDKIDGLNILAREIDNIMFVTCRVLNDQHISNNTIETSQVRGDVPDQSIWWWVQ
jgi:hypothetical protein